MLPELTIEELSGALDCVVSDILDEAGATRPPVDAFVVAESLGFAVAWDERQLGRARLTRLSVEGGAAPGSIMLRREPRKERRQFAVAHEIGEAFAHRVFERLGVSPAEAQPNVREQVANYLAGRLLLPTVWFGRAARECDWDLPVLKRTFSTASHELIARRMLDFPPPVIVTVVDAGRVTFRRTNALGRAPPMCEVERQCQQGASAGEVSDATTSNMTVRAWPIHEPSWRREILRTEVHDGDLEIG